jgi:hypothetical protein
VIHTSGFDATLDIAGKLFAKNQILSAYRCGRPQKRDHQPQDVAGYSDDRSRQLQHALIMPESAPRLQVFDADAVAARIIADHSLDHFTPGMARCSQNNVQPNLGRLLFWFW